MKENPDPDDVDPPSGMMPLLNAVRAGHVEVANALLTPGADVDKADTLGLGLTPVFVAASNGHAMAFTSLIAATAHVDKATTHGTTPVFVVAESGHVQALTSLITANANVGKAMNNMVRVRWHIRGEDLGYPFAIRNEPLVISLTMKKVRSEHYCDTSQNVDARAERLMDIQLPLAMSRSSSA